MQQMDAGEPLRGQQEYGYQAEQGYNRQNYTTPHDSTMFHHDDVKIQPNIGSRVSSGHRLALAIVSIAIIGIMGIAIGSNTALGIGSFFILGVVVVTILLINGFFNRWGVF